MDKIGDIGYSEDYGKTVSKAFANTPCRRGMVVEVHGQGELLADNGRVYHVSSISKQVKIDKCEGYIDPGSDETDD